MITARSKPARYLHVIGTVFLAGCAASPRGIGPALPPAEAAALYEASDHQVSYRWIRENVFRICGYCHPNQKADMFTYQGIRQLIVPGEPEQSLLYRMVYRGQMPPGGMHLKKAELQVIYDWIRQGALNN